jgi:hypothetical protein
MGETGGTIAGVGATLASVLPIVAAGGLAKHWLFD